MKAINHIKYIHNNFNITGRWTDRPFPEELFPILRVMDEGVEYKDEAEDISDDDEEDFIRL